MSGVPPAGTTSFSYSVGAANGVSPNATAGPFTVSVSTPTSGKDRASIELQASAQRVRPGERVTLYAEVSGQRRQPTPTGTVSFTDNGKSIAGCVNLRLPRSGEVTCQLRFASTTGSPHEILAAYSGDETYTPATDRITITVIGGRR